MALNIQELRRIRSDMATTSRSNTRPVQTGTRNESMVDERRLIRRAVDEYDEMDDTDDLIIDDDFDQEHILQRTRTQKTARGLFRKQKPRPEPQYQDHTRVTRSRDISDILLFILILGTTAVVTGVSIWQAITGKTSTDFAYSVRYLHTSMAAMSVNIMIVYLSLRLVIKNTM